MRTFTHFSLHAFERLAQRTSLSCEEVTALLDGGHGVNLGHKPGFQREHLLLYSLADAAHFVAIRDPLVGKVVTILPLAYHADLAWVPTPAELEEATRRAHTRTQETPPEDLPGAPSGDLEPTVIRVSANYLEGGTRHSTRSLGTFPATAGSASVRHFIASPGFMDQVQSRAAQRGLSPEGVFSVILRLGKRGVPVIVDFREGFRGPAPESVNPGDAAGWI